MIYFIGLTLIFLFTMLKTNLIKNEYLKTFLKYVVKSLAIAVILEASIFNFRHYESLFFKNYQELTNYTIGEGLNCKNNKCSITNSEEAYIEFNNINNKINNLYLDISSKEVLHLDYDIIFDDEANKIPFNAGSRNYNSKVLNSHYNKINSSGTSNYLKIKFTKTNHKFTINKVSINKQVPLLINNLRLILVSLITLFIFLINPQNKLHELKYNFPHSKLITWVIIISLSCFFGFLTFFNLKSYSIKKTSQYSQYKNLAHSLAKGEVSLDLEVNPKLLALPNPYDTHYRDANVIRYQEYYWDYAFYNGKYYSYFGVVPCLLTYLPYYTLTNEDLPNPIAMSIAITIFIISLFSLLYEVIKRYFPKTSYIYYILLSIFFILASNIATFTGEATFYSQPIIYAVAFACLGLKFYIKATEKGKLNKTYLFLGSTSMALIAGCRPQLLLVMLLGLVIFKDYIFKKRELFSKKSLPETICLVLPYIVIALLIMAYNYARFQNIFDFGANYNLTSNDMTKRGFRFDRIFAGLYYFLFATTKISPIFPFISKTSVNTSYLGVTIFENLNGGFFFINLICLLSLFYKQFKNTIKDHTLYGLVKYSVTIALLIVLLDTQMAGILPRYFADFGFLLALATCIIILSLLDKKVIKKEHQKYLVAFLCLSIFYNLLTFFLARNVLVEKDFLVNIYDYIYHTFMFWL